MGAEGGKQVAQNTKELYNHKEAHADGAGEFKERTKETTCKSIIGHPVGSRKLHRANQW